MTTESSPEIAALLVTDAQLSDASGVAQSDPLLAAEKDRAKHGMVGAATGLASGIVAALGMVPDVRWPAGVTAACLVAFVVSAVVEWHEGIVVTAIAALAALVWFGIALAGAPAASLAIVLAVTAAAGMATYAIARQLRARRRTRLGYDVLDKLRLSIDRYNGLVRALDVRDRLARAQGKTVDPGELAPVIAVLKSTRANLMRAVTVQRILRENRDVLHGKNRFEDLVPVEALRIEGEAEQYSDVVGETVELAADVQRAYDELRDDIF